MPKYLLQASYAARGEEACAPGRHRSTGCGRRHRAKHRRRARCIYFEFGDHDALAIVDLPDNEAAAAMSLIENHRGAESDDNRAAHTRAGRRSVAAPSATAHRGSEDPVSAPGPLPAIGAFLPLDGKNAPIDREGDVLRYIALLPLQGATRCTIDTTHDTRESARGAATGVARTFTAGDAVERAPDAATSRAAVLALPRKKPMHGYEMITEVEDRTGGAWRPSAGSIYPTLQLLEDEGLIEGTEAEGKRRFELTEAGREERRAPAQRPGTR